MIPVRPADARHKAQLLRLLTAIVDHDFLAHHLFFKGGTAASMLGFLDRFSVDLDFDLDPAVDTQKIVKEFKIVFSRLDLTLKDHSQKVPEFFVQYPAPPNQRSTIKIDAFGKTFKKNTYKPQFLPEIDRLVNCQTVETMFANKLVAPLDRLKRSQNIAGRDFYDLHHFFYHGYKYEPAIITERTKLEPKKYLAKLHQFVSKKLTQTVIDQDINTLLPLDHFQKIRKVIKPELLVFLSDALGNN